MELGLKGKNVLVTGGGNNIGRAIVLAFASEGCNVAIAELDHAAGKRVAAEVSALESGASAIVVDADVTDQARTVAMMNEAIDRLGSVDVLVNNVGWTIDRLFMDKSRDEHVKEVDVNLWGAINCIHAVLPHMIERQSGAIVSISSDAGRIGEYREAVYSACKAGVTALSKSLARENGPLRSPLEHGVPRLGCSRSVGGGRLGEHVEPGHAGPVHGRRDRAGETRLPAPPHGFRPGSRQRGSFPRFRRCQFHHWPDPQRLRWLHHDVARSPRSKQSLGAGPRPAPNYRFIGGERSFDPD